MQKTIGWLSRIGILGFSAAAIAQTQPAQPLVTKYDGTYAFVSSAKVEETYMTATGRMGRCPDEKISRTAAIIILNGQARRYSLAGLVTFEGTVGPQGEMTMRSDTPRAFGHTLRITHGTIDGAGMIRAREIGGGCSFDLIWRKEAKQNQ